MKLSRLLFCILLVAVSPVFFSCVSGGEPVASAPVAAPAAPAALAAPQIVPPAIRAAVKVGEVFTAAFEADVNDIYVELTVEDGATYDIYVVDGYNNGANEGMSIDTPAKAIGYWICKSDAKTTYPESVYKVTDSDSKGGYGFIGFTLEGTTGPVAAVKAEGTVLFIHTQRYKASYTGKFMVKVVKK